MNRIAAALAAALAFASTPCNPEGTLAPKDDTGNGPQDTDTTADTDDTQGMGPCESGLCDLVVTDAVVECASDTTSAPYPLEATDQGGGVVEVWHHRVQQGCCPELDVAAMQDLRNDRIDVTYDLYDDMCDCICDLDIRYTLSDLYSGTFTLYAAEDSVEVTVE